MSQIKFYKRADLPSSPTSADDGVYFVKPNGANPMKVYLIHSGSVVDLDAVDAAGFAAALALKADDNTVVKLTGTQTVGGAKTFSIVPKSAQDASGATDLVRKSQFDSGLSAKADDNAVVKLTGTQTVGGAKTFTIVPKSSQDASASTDLIRKSQLDALLSAINAAIEELKTAVTDGLSAPTDLDCSTNPNYPASDVGDRYIVSADGRIGGASGPELTVGDLIVCKTDNAGGTHAAVGANFFILQTNIHDATTTVKGYIQLATQAEVNTASNTSKAITPATLQVKLDALETAILNASQTRGDERYVRYDTASQGLNGTQQGNARSNIGAASDSEVVKTTGTQTVGGAKTFSSVPKSSQDASASTDLVRKSQFDSGLSAKADDNTVVKLTGNQTVAGKKTFSTVPASSQAPSAASDLTRKDYVDSAVAEAILEWEIDNWA